MSQPPMTKFEVRPWLVLASFSLVFFLINGSTYSALGVVLPNMVREEHWSYTIGGLGFTLLGSATGASSMIPAFLIRRVGVRLTLAIGTAIIVAGFTCLSVTHDPITYFVGTALCGVGYQTMALIPGTYVLGAIFKHRGFPFGLYFTSASLGGIVWPALTVWIMQLVHDQWRVFWMTQAVAAVAVGVTCILMAGSRKWLAARAAQTDQEVAEDIAAPKPSRVYRTAVDWTARQAVRTPQFYVLLAAYFGHMLVGITIASWSIGHLTERGVSIKLAAIMLGVESGVGAIGRAVGGALGDIVDPRYLLMFALAALTVGGLALSVAHGDTPLLLVYAVGSGLGFGITALAVTLLLLNYYGRKDNLAIFSRLCLIGAVSAFGPVIAGKIRDTTGGFGLSFQIYSGVILVILAGVVFMRPPRLKTQSDAEEAQAGLAGSRLDARPLEDPA